MSNVMYNPKNERPMSRDALANLSLPPKMGSRHAIYPFYDFVCVIEEELKNERRCFG